MKRLLESSRSKYLLSFAVSKGCADTDMSSVNKAMAVATLLLCVLLEAEIMCRSYNAANSSEFQQTPFFRNMHIDFPDG